jgi:hypothetical protein
MSRVLPWVRSLAALGVSALLFGCGTDQASTSPPPPPQASDPVAVAIPVDEPAAPVDQPLPESGVIRELNLGDRACYVTVENAAGSIDELMAVMELCVRDELIGQSVRLEYELGLVTAESCQGDPECNDSEMVQLVVDVAPVGAGSAQ